MLKTSRPQNENAKFEMRNSKCEIRNECNANMPYGICIAPDVENTNAKLL